VLPRLDSSKLVTPWILATLVLSIGSALSGGHVADWLALAPSAIWHGQVWRLVTWPLVELSPMSLIVTCGAIYKLGTPLAVRWGERRLRRFVFHIVLASGLGATLVATLFGAHLWRCGGWAVGDLLVIAWARQFRDASLQFYGVIELQGDRIVIFACAVPALFALYYGPLYLAPELFACAATVMYPRG
jgi:hypothetical protein